MSHLLRRALRAAAAATCVVSRPSILSWEYAKRRLIWSPSSADDWRRFPSRAIKKSERPQPYAPHPDAAEEWSFRLRELRYPHAGRSGTVALDVLLASTGTTAFVLIKDGKLLLETYLGEQRRESMVRAFSISKAIIGALTGAALRENRIQHLDDAFVNYLPELRRRGCDRITIRHLLLMSAGFRFSYGRSPCADASLLYWHPNIRRVIREKLPLVAPPGERFLYSGYSTCVLGMVLERVTGMTLAEYCEQRLWNPLGAEFDASWSVDHGKDGCEYAASGLNARAIDLVKFGSLYLNGGRVGERQVLPRSWVLDSVTPSPQELPGHCDEDRAENVYYKYGWWGHDLRDNDLRFWADGHLGQFIYVFPRKQLVIARFGRHRGSVGRAWPTLLRAIAEAVP
jgi:CubicO group peptidase (beta-lactamase class C family)